MIWRQHGACTYDRGFALRRFMLWKGLGRLEKESRKDEDKKKKTKEKAGQAAPTRGISLVSAAPPWNFREASSLPEEIPLVGAIWKNWPAPTRRNCSGRRHAMTYIFKVGLSDLIPNSTQIRPN